MPSTTKATGKDWPDILKVCFDNREADIGRFLRRHLTGTNPQVVREFLETLTSDSHPKATTEDSLRKYLQKCENRYFVVVGERRVQPPPHGAWEALLVFLDSEDMNAIDFMRLSPEGRFYLRQAFEDDIRNSPDAPAPMTCLDFTLPLRRVAESVSVGIAFAKAMGCDPEKTKLAFGFPVE